MYWLVGFSMLFGSVAVAQPAPASLGEKNMPHRALLFLNGPASVPNDTETLINFSRVGHNIGGGFAVEGGGVKVLAGINWVRASYWGVWAGSGAGDRQLVPVKNGNFFPGTAPSNMKAISLTTSDHGGKTAWVPVVENDLIRIRARQNSGNSLVLRESTGTWFMVEGSDDPLPDEPSSGEVFSDPTPTASGNPSNGYTYINRNQPLQNFGTLTKIGLYSENAVTLTVKVLRAIADDAYDCVVSESFSHPGGGWADHTLSAAFVVPPEGAFYPAFHLATAAPNIGKYLPGIFRAYASGDVTGNGVSFTAVDSAGAAAMRLTY